MTAAASSPLMPRLRFPEFRDALPWDAPRGDALFESVNNRNAPPGLPVLAITQEQGAIPREQIDYHVSVTAQSIANYKEVCEGDFIIGPRSFQGGIECSQYHGICSPAYVILRRRGDENVQFFRHLFKLNRFIQQLTRNLEGIRDGKMISYAQFSEQRIPLPKPPEQQKIADCLGSLDDLIAAQDRKLAALRKHKQGLMQQLFPQPGETVPRLRFPEFREGREWKRTSLAEAFKTITNGKANSQDHQDSGEHPLFDRSEVVKRSSTFLFDAEAVILTDEGMSFQPRYFKGKFNLHQRAYALMDAKVIPFFAFYALDRFKSDLTERAVHSTVPSLRLPIMEKFTIPCPEVKAEQQRIAGCLSSFDVQIAAESERLKALRQHKQGLMQQLFPSLEGR